MGKLSLLDDFLSFSSLVFSKNIESRARLSSFSMTCLNCKSWILRQQTTMTEIEMLAGLSIENKTLINRSNSFLRTNKMKLEGLSLSARSLVLCVLLVFSSSSLLGGSRSEAFRCNGLQTSRAPLLTQQTKAASFATFVNKRSCLFSTPEDDDDDDGWGTPVDETNDQQSNFDRDRKVDELRYLQEQANNKVSSPSRSRELSEPPERDMFIPIMAIVSLLGLFGAYGYETLRLASRGELYLPF